MTLQAPSFGAGKDIAGPPSSKCSSACGRSGDGAGGAEHHLGNGNSPGEQLAGLVQLPLPSADAIKQASVFRETSSPKNSCSAKHSSKGTHIPEAIRIKILSLSSVLSLFHTVTGQAMLSSFI